MKIVVTKEELEQIMREALTTAGFDVGEGQWEIRTEGSYDGTTKVMEGLSFEIRTPERSATDGG